MEGGNSGEGGLLSVVISPRGARAKNATSGKSEVTYHSLRLQNHLGQVILRVELRSSSITEVDDWFMMLTG